MRTPGGDGVRCSRTMDGRRALRRQRFRSPFGGRLLGGRGGAIITDVVPFGRGRNETLNYSIALRTKLSVGRCRAAEAWELALGFYGTLVQMYAACVGRGRVFATEPNVRRGRPFLSLSC
jgi:hypothetical protein